MQCILCEKPSAAKNFATALGGYKGSYNGKQYEIVSSHGHLFGMPGPEEQVDKELIDQYKSWSIDFLPWDYRDLKFKRKLMKDASDTFNKIRDVAKNCDELVIATDDDPTGEGTLLANEIIEAINLKGVKYYRCFHVDESPKEIQKAMKNLTFLGTDPKTDPDFKKAEFRSKWDYLSMQWTRVFTNYSGDRSVLRQGRLKSYMVWVVGEQLRKISEYQKIPYYQARFRDENGNIYSSKNEEMYEKMGDVPIGKFSTSTIVKEKPEKKYKAPPALYDLNMISAVLAPMGFGPKKVLETYQQMYQDHVVSYPRTEDKKISPEQFNEFLDIADKVAKVVGVDPKMLTHKAPRKTHVETGGSHGANRPASNVPASMKAIEDKYGKCGAVIYDVLARNTLAMLCEDCCYMHETGYIKDFPDFRGAVNSPVSLGYKAIFKDEEIEESKPLGSKAVPFVYEGFPPKPEAPTAKWLAKQLEKNDVGTGSTRTSIYADVIDPTSKYPLMSENKGKISMTDYGNVSYGLLKNTHIGDVKLTEGLQKQMRDVAKGSDPNIYLAEVAKLIVDDIETVRENAKAVRPSEILSKCPVCGKELKKSQYGYYCSGYNKEDPDSCRFSISRTMYGGNLSDKDIDDLLKKGKTAKEVKLKSKEGKPYKAILTVKEGKIVPEFTRNTVGDVCCPYCGGKLLIDDFGVQCEHVRNKECDFRIYRKIAGKKLTDKQLKTLLVNGETDVIEGFVSKKGTNFSAKIALDEDKHTKFVF